MPDNRERDPIDDERPDVDWEAILGDSNAGAYRLTEQRTGPPLRYVAEKLRGAIEQIHATHARLRPDDDARASAQAALHYALVAYLALNNMLTLAGDHEVVTRLLALTRTDLDRWLDGVDAEGSVTG